VLQQSALDPLDSYCSPRKQFLLLQLVMGLFDLGAELIRLGAPVQELAEHPLLAQVRRAKSNWGSEEADRLEAFCTQALETFVRLKANYSPAPGLQTQGSEP
jgi:V/A-type H+-transporting ATPase subunit A